MKRNRQRQTASEEETKAAGLCATPLAFILFLNPKIAYRTKPYQQYLFPALAIPLIAGLLISPHTEITSTISGG